MFAAKGADVLRGLLTDGTGRGREMTGASTRSSFAVHSERNVSSEVTIVHFVRQRTQIYHTRHAHYPIWVKEPD